MSKLESRLRNGEIVKMPLGNDLCEISWKESMSGAKMFHILLNDELVSLSVRFKSCQLKLKSILNEKRTD